MASEYEIALAQSHHLAALADIELSAATLFEGYGPAASVLGEHTPLDVFLRAQEQQRLWVALAGQCPIGFALVEMLDADHPHLQEMDVRPEHGRRGVGRALLEAVCAWGARQRYRAITLTTFRGVRWNYPFYSQFGFVEPSPGRQGLKLQAIVEDERARGLDPSERIVMSYRLESSA